MAKKAVLIGCNYPGTKDELRGCVNDVRRTYNCLTERYGFSDDDIAVLIDTDPSYTQPTGMNIRSAITMMIRSSEPGDVLFVHYSGHGVCLPAEPGDADDTGYDECIVPCDMNLITDGDFRELVKEVPRGCRITIVADSCHSGGLIEDAKEQIGDSTKRKVEEQGHYHHPSTSAFGFRSFLRETMEEAVESCGIQIPSAFCHHRTRHNKEEDVEEKRDIMDDGKEYGYVKNRSLPLSSLMEMLTEKTGKDDINVGNLRFTLFDIFKEDTSPQLKKFINVVLGKLHHQGLNGESENTGADCWGWLGSLVREILKHKLDENAKPAMETPVGSNREEMKVKNNWMDCWEWLGSLTQEFLKHKSDEDEARAKPTMETHVGNNQEVYVGSTKGGLVDGGILMSGCQSDQTSADAKPFGNSDDKAYGAFSNAIQSIIEETSGEVTNQELVLKARKKLKKQGLPQQPGLYCSDRHVHAPFVC